MSRRRRLLLIKTLLAQALSSSASDLRNGGSCARSSDADSPPYECWPDPAATRQQFALSRSASPARCSACASRSLLRHRELSACASRFAAASAASVSGSGYTPTATRPPRGTPRTLPRPIARKAVTPAVAPAAQSDDRSCQRGVRPRGLIATPADCCAVELPPVGHRAMRGRGALHPHARRIFLSRRRDHVASKPSKNRSETACDRVSISRLRSEPSAHVHWSCSRVGDSGDRSFCWSCAHLVPAHSALSVRTHRSHKMCAAIPPPLK